MKKITILGTALSCVLYAGGYKIPEQSGDSVAMAGANIAASFGADASYYNPANMMFLDDSRHMFELSGTLVHLGKTTFVPDNDDGKENYATTSRNFNGFVPAFHFVSPEYIPDVRFGLSMVVPAGLTMRWDESYPASTAKIFSLKVFELNPNVAYRVNDKFALGFGLRAVYVSGKVGNEAVERDFGGAGKFSATRELTGSDLNFGWNVAATYKPTDALTLGATYRSKVDLNLKGDANIKSRFTPKVNPSVLPSGHPLKPMLEKLMREYNGEYKGDVAITIPLPATLDLAASYKFNDTTFMVAFERTFWSKLQEFNFEYGGDVPSAKIFDEPTKKEWHDANTYRIAVSHNVNEKLRVMAGFAYDESVAQSDRVGFELPETSARIYSTGFNYKFSENLEAGVSYLYQDRTNRHVDAKSEVKFNKLEGEMLAGDVQLINASFKYRF